MKLYSSMFDASTWATRGGLVGIDWKKGPFISSYTGNNMGLPSGSLQKITERCLFQYIILVHPNKRLKARFKGKVPQALSTNLMQKFAEFPANIDFML